MHGTTDSAISTEQFATLAKELESAGVAHEMITYGGADHAFNSIPLSLTRASLGFGQLISNAICNYKTEL